MRVNKIVILSILMVLFSAYKIYLFQIDSISGIYFDIPFIMDVKTYIVSLSIFALYEFSIFMECEEFILNYGIFLVIRNNKRSKIYNRIIKKAFIYIIILEAVKIISSVIMIYLYNGAIKIDIIDFFKGLSMFLITLFILIMINILLEIFINSKTAIFTILSSYIFFSFIGVFMINVFKDIISDQIIMVFNLFCLPNYMIKNRTDILCSSLDVSRINVFIILAVIVLIIYGVSRKLFNKCDLI